jgi:nicotinamide-nucleotide amidase
MVVGDRPDDLLAALRFLSGLDLVITSGGLGPTADDLTAEVVADFAGLPVAVDAALEARIYAIVERLRSRWRDASDEGMREGARKQALVPAGAEVLEPVGTAPGLVVPVADGPLVVVLPGPPGELQPMWAAAVGSPRLAPLLSGTLSQRIMRMTGVPESELARTLRGLDVSGLEVTTCLRRGELEIATVFPASESERYAQFEAALLERHGSHVFARAGETVDEIVAGLLLGPPVRTIATAESCTGGLMAARLTDRAGSSAYVRGGVTAYANAAKVELAGVDAALIARHGAVSPEVAAALAAGAVARFGADLGIGITGIAGPDGGSEAKPVGTVCLCVAGTAGVLSERTVHLPGDRSTVRERTTTVVMHMLRRLLAP